MAINFPNAPTLNETFSSGGSTWEWDGTTWNLLSSSVGQAVFKTVTGNSGSVTAVTPDDSLAISGGTGISTSVTGNTLTITNTAGGGGGGVTQNIFENFIVGTDTATPTTPTDNFTFVAGSNVTLSLDTGTNSLTINSTGGGGGGATAFTDLTDVTSAAINVGHIYEPAVAMYRVTAQGTSAYLFGDHFPGNNPTLYAITGTTIAFDLSGAGGHPFEIQDSTGTAYNTGLVHVSNTGTVSTGASANGQQNGYLYWRIPLGISGNYRYQCTAHAAMFGPITLKQFNLL